MDEEPKLVAPGTARGNQWQVSVTHANLVRVPAQPRPITISTGNRIVPFDLARTAGIASSQSSE